ncbi:hypothetical protein GCK32_014583, partial [Trichostrongylus colubriformis]
LTGDISTALPTTHLADGCDKGDDETYDREGSLRNWLSTQCAKEISHLRLAIAAEVIEKIRANIRRYTQFFCSGGIANNKMLAKLVCARHKPRQQTVLPFEYVHVIFETTPIGDVRMLGGKLGHALQDRFAIGTSKTLKIASYSPQVLAEIMWSAARGYNRAPSGSDKWDPPILNLSMSASRFVEGVGAQNQSIMEWIDKRLKSIESGNSAFEQANNSTPEPRIFVKGVLKRPADLEVPGPSCGMSSASNSPKKATPKKKKPDAEPEVKVDEDGWQVYDPALFEALKQQESSSAVPAVELNDIGGISSAVFQELPDNIKAVCF